MWKPALVSLLNTQPQIILHVFQLLVVNKGWYNIWICCTYVGYHYGECLNAMSKTFDVRSIKCTHRSTQFS